MMNFVPKVKFTKLLSCTKPCNASQILYLWFCRNSDSYRYVRGLFWNQNRMCEVWLYFWPRLVTKNGRFACLIFPSDQRYQFCSYEIPHKNRVDFQNFFVDKHFTVVFCLYHYLCIIIIREKMFEELKNLQVLDYVRSGALAIGLLAALFHGKFL